MAKTTNDTMKKNSLIQFLIDIYDYQNKDYEDELLKTFKKSKKNNSNLLNTNNSFKIKG